MLNSALDLIMRQLRLFPTTSTFFLFSSRRHCTSYSTYATMAGNTKYQAAPQRDSFDEPSYSQAPPSYQAEASDPMLGGPRGEDDNIPDDFKVTTHTGNTRYDEDADIL